MSFLRKLFSNESNAALQTTPLPENRAAPGTTPLPESRAVPGTAPLPPDDAPPPEAAPTPPDETVPSPDTAPTPPAGNERPWWDTEIAPQPSPAPRGTAPLPPDDTTLEEHIKLDTATPASTLVASDVNTPAKRGLAAATLRDIGQVRAINQDNVFALLTTVPLESSDLTVGLFIVADGMGGHDHGEVASRLAVNTVAREVLSRLLLPALAEGITTDMQSVIVEAVQTANQAIWNHGRSIGSDMGTTCTAALLLGHTLYVGHVGDSRLYVRTPTGLECITDDHSAVGRLIQLGQLDPEEAREHPLRSQLYRTVGQMPEIAVDYIYYQLGDASHLLLCSDGLWGLVEDDDIRAALDQHLWPQAICHSLIERANNAGGDDNISAVVVTLPGA